MNFSIEQSIHFTSTAFRLLLVLSCLSTCKTSYAEADEPASDGPPPKTAPTERNFISANRAFDRLKAGNERFAKLQQLHPHEGKQRRRTLVEGQHPFATILGCSDSRVIPELVFDEGLGDLFVIRVAGQVVDQSVTASIEYGVEHLDTRLVVVLGHDNCGAVTAALAPPHDEPRELNSLVNQIYNTIYSNYPDDSRLPEKMEIVPAVRKNVMSAVRQLRVNPTVRRCLKKHNAVIVGAIYHLDSGQVHWLEQSLQGTILRPESHDDSITQQTNVTPDESKSEHKPKKEG